MTEPEKRAEPKAKVEEPKEVPTVAQPETYTDGRGIDRIVPSTIDDGWEPAQVEPDPEAVKAAKAREAEDKKRSN